MEEYIAVIAGTTESKAVVEKLLKEKECPVAFVATKLGTDMFAQYGISIVEGRKTEEEFFAYFKQHRPKKVFDASHPFADIVTANVKEACQRLKIPYERVVRKSTQYDYENLIMVSDTREAIEYLKSCHGPILLTTGVKTAGTYQEHLEGKEIFVRVLKKGNSLWQCLKSGYDKEHVIELDPPFSIEDNEQLIRKTRAAVLVTKDSGVPGGVPEKIEAAKRCHIPVLMIQKPEERKVPRLLVTAAGSGTGKTTITLGLMQCLKNRGLTVQGYKCGPDYIDPMYHTRLTGRASVNLDPVFHKGRMGMMFDQYSKGADIGILEGVMGFYDGIGSTTEGSTYEVAKETKTPAVLILSVKGIANTIIPMIQGILNYQENTIKAVILNQCSKGFYQQIAPKIEEECGICVAGYVPVNDTLTLTSRHLGLTMAGEMKQWETYLYALADQIEETVEVDQLLSLAKKAKDLNTKEEHISKEYPVRIGVALDEAFCFYYEDNFRMLEALGVELRFFSPMRDEKLPEDIQGIYLGGGYPELFAKELEENQSIRMEIRQWCQDGKPILAECGGYMYLGQSIKNQQGQTFAMCQAFGHRTEMKERLNLHFGYVTILAEEPAGLLTSPIKGHEFHYSAEYGDDFTCIVKKNEKRSWKSGYVTKNQYCAYPHLSFRGNESFIKNFLEQVKEELV